MNLVWAWMILAGFIVMIPSLIYWCSGLYITARKHKRISIVFYVGLAMVIAGSTFQLTHKWWS